jgi:hypothetical protein
VAIAAAALAVNQALGAVGKVVDALKVIPDAVRGFVDALNPAAGMRFDWAMRSLSATIGYALEPVLETATRTVNEFAGAISEGMDRLRAPMQAVGSTFMTVIRPLMGAINGLLGAFMDSVEGLMPLLEPVGVVLEEIMIVLRWFLAATTGGLMTLIKYTILGGQELSKVTEWLTDGFIGLVEATLKLTYWFLWMTGQTEMFKKILEAVGGPKPPGEGRKAAPTGYAVTTLEDLYRKRLVSAAMAGAGTSVEEKQLSVQERIEDMVRRMKEEMEKPGGGKLGEEAVQRTAEAIPQAPMALTAPGGPLTWFTVEEITKRMWNYFQRPKEDRTGAGGG